MRQLTSAIAAVLCLVGCRAEQPRPTLPSAYSSGAVSQSPCPSGGSPYPPAKEDPSTRDRYLPGGLYRPGVKDRSPGVSLNIACIPEPEVKDEPRSDFGNQSPYTVLGRRYEVLSRSKGYVARGLASYYGVKFHGRLTSNHEVYDMYALTAAHRTLPIPSFALVTNVQTGASVVVRINDRGPFHSDRIIDLSYAAAVKLNMVKQGTAVVEVRAVTPSDAPLLLARRSAPVAPEHPLPSPVAQSSPARAGAAALSPLSPEAMPLAPQPIASHPAAGQSSSPIARLSGQLGSSPLSLADGRSSLSSARTAVADRDGASQSSHVTIGPDGSHRVENASLQSVQLQVASYAVRANADRARAQLVSAGIGAHVNDVRASGQTLWRVSVFAPDLTSASTLAERIARLGFEMPQIASHRLRDKACDGSWGTDSAKPRNPNRPTDIRCSG